ncbi:hypothetical protein BDN70DRAFT_884139 [Pholiota conissans]|uniref:Nephrocystin 3-like N-terminal domain-containing protein n=1 Tax=Pholiota conissans TaxID=109636 RepID=A0A9P5YUQ4_9AGAR|nr:hypothetical protein BDN70DRAFT_884139 [Pholiota conissans]
MFNSNTGRVRIQGGSFTSILGDVHYYGRLDELERMSVKGKQKALDLLRQHITPGAFHDSDERYDPPKCHPHTRQAVLRKILNWLNDPTYCQSFLWLHGPAGAGKSAIAQTIAEICHEAGCLGACFFFCRTALLRNSKTHLIATLAYQLTLHLPSIVDHVAKAVDKDPSIFSRNLASQMKALIIKPLNDAVKEADNTSTWCRRPVLLIVDGLDECNGPKAQHYILQILSDCAQCCILPIRFLVASRSEQEIREAFGNEYLASQTLLIALDDMYHPDDDIYTFLSSRFDDIRSKHPYRRTFPGDWPSADILQQLTTRSSGQFIYAATVMKYIESRRHSPRERLDVILGLSNPGDDAPFSELDAIYNHILSSVANITPVLEILHYMIRYDCSANGIRSVLGYTWDDIQLLLADLHALIDVPDMVAGSGAVDSNPELSFYHASLADYLADPSRAKEFYVLPGNLHARFAQIWIKFSLSPHKAYIQPFHNVSYHCTQATLTPELVHELSRVDMMKIYGCTWGGVHKIFEWLKNQGTPTAERLYHNQLSHFADCMRGYIQCYPPDIQVYIAMILGLPEPVNSPAFCSLLALSGTLDETSHVTGILPEFLFGEPAHRNPVEEFTCVMFNLLTGGYPDLPEKLVEVPSPENWYALVSYYVAKLIIAIHDRRRQYFPSLIQLMNDLVCKALINHELADFLRRNKFEIVDVNSNIVGIESISNMEELVETVSAYVQKCDSVAGGTSQ